VLAENPEETSLGCKHCPLVHGIHVVSSRSTTEPLKISVLFCLVNDDQDLFTVLAENAGKLLKFHRIKY